MASSGLKAEMTQGLIWHYNVPVPIQQVSGPQHGWYQALVNGLEYTGVQAFNKLPAEVQQHLNQILENLRDAAILCCLGIDGQWNFLLHSELRLEEILITITDPLACYAATNTSQIWG